MSEKEDPETMKRAFRIYFINCRHWLIPIWVVVLIILFSTGVLKLSAIGDWVNGFGHALGHWSIFKHTIPYIVFVVIAVWVSVKAVIRQWSLVPVMGVLTNMYLISELGITNWMGFSVWLVVGLLLYFTYGSRHSKLIKKKVTA